MRILITGGAGFLGQRLAVSLLDHQKEAVESLTLFDRSFLPESLIDNRLHTDAGFVEAIVGDISDPSTASSLIETKPTHIFHLAAVVSGEAEQDFELGMQVNLAATQLLLETCRKQQHVPMFIMTSSVAVFGGDMPQVLADDTAPVPQSSYGTQKAICELLVNDYSRRGFVNGRVLRVPTVVVRAGKPNAATSSFASSIIREPLSGERAICPVTPETELWIMSPRQAVGSLVHSMSLSVEQLGGSRVISLPGVTITVQGMVDSLRFISGDEVADLIDWLPDPFIQSIVGSWPAHFESVRALNLGFMPDSSFDEIVRCYIEDELQ